MLSVLGLSNRTDGRTDRVVMKQADASADVNYSDVRIRTTVIQLRSKCHVPLLIQLSQLALAQIKHLLKCFPVSQTPQLRITVFGMYTW